jgi:hypothetical protein
VVSDALDRDLVTLDHGTRRTPVAGATQALHASLRTARATLPTRLTDPPDRPT